MVCGFVFVFALSLFGSVSVAGSADTFENESFGETSKFATKRSLTVEISSTDRAEVPKLGHLLSTLYPVGLRVHEH
ncbi:hypothetical protein BC629DRAFT_1528730 [Irpex lacteus]|nr:hypothetical protein BC629DRAFT_1528730 [Irpex lacteus]